jgi:predicted class III extradiol MEMO1 family dioxygenase
LLLIQAKDWDGARRLYDSIEAKEVEYSTSATHASGFFSGFTAAHVYHRILSMCVEVLERAREYTLAGHEHHHFALLL